MYKGLGISSIEDVYCFNLILIFVYTTQKLTVLDECCYESCVNTKTYLDKFNIIQDSAVVDKYFVLNL